jgi:hypothetical protein
VGARHKLNAGYFNGSLLLAAALGWLAESWSVFLLALGALLCLNLWQGEIRPRVYRQRRAGRRYSPVGKEKQHESEE